MYGVDFVWLRRVQGIAVTSADLKLPDMMADLEREWLRVVGEWKGWLDSVPETSLNDRITYVMFDGKQYSTPLWQLVLHVVNHGTLHGGQVVAMLRQAGVTPPQTDILFFYREMEAQAAGA